MTPHIERRAASEPARAAGAGPQRLVDLMYEGFYALFLLKNGCGPHDKAGFADHMTAVPGRRRPPRQAARRAADDVAAAKYAFARRWTKSSCARNTTCAKRGKRGRCSCALFGDQLAGEHFFHSLEDLRARGSVHLQALEVFHMCLLLGFQGRYALDGAGQAELPVARGWATRSRACAARTAASRRTPSGPTRSPTSCARDLSLWVLTAVFALAGLGAYVGFRAMLGTTPATRWPATTTWSSCRRAPPT